MQITFYNIPLWG